MTAWDEKKSHSLQSPNHLITKGSLSLLDQILGHNLVISETGSVPKYSMCTVAKWTSLGWCSGLCYFCLSIPLSLVFHLSSTISRAALEPLPQCCCPKTPGKQWHWHPIWRYCCFNTLWAFSGMSALSPWPTPEACVFLVENSFSGLPRWG